MDYEEALAWLRGERSTVNTTQQYPIETWQERIARTDAAMTEQAYWIVRAHSDGVNRAGLMEAPSGVSIDRTSTIDGVDFTLRATINPGKWKTLGALLDKLGRELYGAGKDRQVNLEPMLQRVFGDPRPWDTFVEEEGP